MGTDKIYRSKQIQTIIFGLNICVSAFLLFQIQPILAKIILPWFGGSGSVWTVCMLFYQTFLLLGYLLAHLLSKIDLKLQTRIYAIALISSALTLDILPGDEWKPTPESEPILSIIVLLLAHIGLPYTMLSMTSSLLQSWHNKIHKTNLPYQLYAISNLGSLIALISFPFLIEPNLASVDQVKIWTKLFYLIVVLGVIMSHSVQKSFLRNQAHLLEIEKQPHFENPSFSKQLYWLILSASASILLIASTNILCSEISSNPLMWTLTLSIYLLSFIICFGNETYYNKSRGLYILIFIFTSSVLFIKGRTLVEIMIIGCLTLASGCMICHGELVREKPAKKFLTNFYLIVSAGGALGGLFVGIISPIIFSSYFEMETACLLISIIFYLSPIRNILKRSARDITRSELVKLTILSLFIFQLSNSVTSEFKHYSKIDRNFYGVLKIQETEKSNPEKAMRSQLSGRTIHGSQYLQPEKETKPTCYYGESSAIGLAINYLIPDQAKVGLIGLGAGVIASLARVGDEFKYYEINPLSINHAINHFSFLKNSRARHSIVEGDARLNLEHSQHENFDLLLIDAFSSDSIPTHLLTSEAFSLYLSHLSDNGILLFHISNRNLDFKPLFFQYADDSNLNAYVIASDGDHENGLLPSIYILITKKGMDVEKLIPPSDKFLIRPSLLFPKRLRWTDDFSNVYSIITFEHPTYLDKKTDRALD